MFEKATDLMLPLGHRRANQADSESLFRLVVPEALSRIGSSTSLLLLLFIGDSWTTLSVSDWDCSSEESPRMMVVSSGLAVTPAEPVENNGFGK